MRRDVCESPGLVDTVVNDMNELPFLVKKVRFWAEPNVTMISEIIRDWNHREDADVGIVGVPFDGGVSVKRGARYAPASLRAAIGGQSTFNLEQEIDVSLLKIVDCGNVDVDNMDFDESHRRIEAAMTAIFGRSMVPMILGGDHSITYPCVKALHNSMKGKRIGIIDFDSDLDMRSGWEHHTGSWVRQIQEIPDKPVKGENIVQIGIHSFRYSQFYWETVKKMGVSIFKTSEVRRRGIEEIMKEAFERASDGTDSIYVSLDIDVLDQTFAPASPAKPNGMEPWDLMAAMAMVGRHKSVRAFDIVEIVPPVEDTYELTTRVGGEALLHFLGGLAHRKKGISG